MGSFEFNIALGRIVELYNRVKSNDPTNSAFILVPIDRGAVTDATLKDLDALSNVTSAVTERTSSGWSRKTITDSSLASLPAPDDTNDRRDLDLPDQTWTAPSAGAVTDLILCYDSDTTGGADSAIVPLLCFAWPVTPDGTDAVVNWNASGFYRAPS